MRAAAAACVLGLGLGLGGCTSILLIPTTGGDEGGPTGGGTTGDADDPEANTTGPTDPSLSTTTPPPETTTGLDESSSGADGVGFIQTPDGGSDTIECSIWDQDCPEGEKCMPWANDGGASWNATRCSPLAEDPGQVDDPCTVERSGVSGIDDCDVGLMCWDVDPMTNTGECVPMCIDEMHPHCEDETRVCSIAGCGVLALCLSMCSPLVSDCGAGMGCYPVGGSFLCAPDASGEGGAFGDDCMYLNDCDPGLYCIASEGVPDCETASCCSPFCDTTAANSCPGQGQECMPWFDPEEAGPGQDVIGICTVPS